MERGIFMSVVDKLAEALKSEMQIQNSILQLRAQLQDLEPQAQKNVGKIEALTPLYLEGTEYTLQQAYDVNHDGLRTLVEGQTQTPTEDSE